MSLDQNLFTLLITPRPKEPHIVELTDPSGTVHYRKERLLDAKVYSFDVYDPLSESLLATVSAPVATSKVKTVELHNPSVPVELKYSGTFSFKWSFQWEEHEFEWKREECFLVRKPDPPVLVAITKEPPGKIKTRSVQILDYNLNRFDIQDRKGLEIVLLSALLSFSDFSDDHHQRREENVSTSSQLSVKPAKTPDDPLPPVPSTPPELPPKPKEPVKTPLQAIADLQTGELNEIVVSEEGDVLDYAKYCANLLEGDMLDFIVLRSSSAETVPKVLQVVHEATRIRHKAGEEEELHKYVRYDNDPSNTMVAGKKTPKIIYLDDDANHKNKYRPPESLTVHLSKIPMPELQPQAHITPKAEGKTKGKEKEEVSKKKEEKAKDKKKDKKAKEAEDVKSKSKDKGKERDDRKGRGSPPEPIRRRPSSADGAELNFPGSYPRTEGNKLSKPSRHSPPREPPPQSRPPPSPHTDYETYKPRLRPPPASTRPPHYPPPPSPPHSHANGQHSQHGSYQGHPPNSNFAPPSPVTPYGGYYGPPPPMPPPPPPPAPIIIQQQRPSTAADIVSGLFGKLNLRL